ncbi:MAG: sulfur carrier protein ThiS [Nitriliruptorales bacterium]|nr:sulfur carrier protein ThiS [Nitriliruptorales bacterium]
MKIRLNGEAIECRPDETVGSLVDRLRPAGRHGVAVAVDGAVVRRATWDDTTLSDGARVELVGAVQGG